MMFNNLLTFSGQNYFCKKGVRNFPEWKCEVTACKKHSIFYCLNNKGDFVKLKTPSLLMGFNEKIT